MRGPSSPPAVPSKGADFYLTVICNVYTDERLVFRTEEALIPIRKESPNADIRVVSLDLADESSIRAAAKEVLALNLPINVSLWSLTYHHQTKS